LTAVYGSRRPRRPASGLEQHRAKRRSRPFRLADLGAWARKSQAAGVAPAACTGAKTPLVVRSSASLNPQDPTRAGRLPIDWPGLLTAGYPDPRGAKSVPADDLHRLGTPLVRQAFAAHAGRRDRIVLVTSAGPAEGRTFVTISLALSLARDRPVLLVDADPGAAGTAARFDLTAAKGLSDALADPSLGPDRLITRTELDHLALLGPGRPGSDLLGLIASRRTVELLHDLFAEAPGRLILIDGPPLCRPEAQALALFAGQVVLVVAAGETTRGAVETALERLGARPNVSLLLNRARVTEGVTAAER
jgi:Mrp family chromosome partitioning ATPase